VQKEKKGIMWGYFEQIISFQKEAFAVSLKQGWLPQATTFRRRWAKCKEDEGVHRRRTCVR
jgi:hypothetical protein